jgi:hypothetical protein
MAGYAEQSCRLRCAAAKPPTQAPWQALAACPADTPNGCLAPLPG